MPSADLIQRLHRVLRQIDVEMHRLAPSFDSRKVGALGTMTLKRISTLAPVPTHEIVQAMWRDPSQMSRVIARLEEKGLLQKAPREGDRRVTVLTLTEAGAAHVAQVDAVMDTVADEAFGVLDPEDRKDLDRILAKLPP